MTNANNRRELEKALEQLELAIDLKSDEAADAYAAGKKVEWRSLVKAFLTAMNATKSQPALRPSPNTT